MFKSLRVFGSVHVAADDTNRPAPHLKVPVFKARYTTVLTKRLRQATISSTEHSCSDRTVMTGYDNLTEHVGTVIGLEIDEFFDSR